MVSKSLGEVPTRFNMCCNRLLQEDIYCDTLLGRYVQSAWIHFLCIFIYVRGV